MREYLGKVVSEEKLGSLSQQQNALITQIVQLLQNNKDSQVVQWYDWDSQQRSPLEALDVIKYHAEQERLLDVTKVGNVVMIHFFHLVPCPDAEEKAYLVDALPESIEILPRKDK